MLDPVQVGSFIASQNAMAAENLAVHYKDASRADRFLSRIFSFLRQLLDYFLGLELGIMSIIVRRLPENARIWLGCDCHYAEPYGWVVSADCPYHD
jgi:hypothetical protein